MTSITVNGRRKPLLDDLAEHPEHSDACGCGKECLDLVQCDECGKEKCAAFVPETPSGIRLCVPCNADLSRTFGTNYSDSASV